MLREDDAAVAASVGINFTTNERSVQLITHPSIVDVPALITQPLSTRQVMFSRAEYEEENLEHLANAKGAILQAAMIALERIGGMQEKKAIVFGAGHLFDIPIRRLTELFDSVTLVEFYAQGTDAAIKQILPKALQEKVVLICADITGVVSKYCQDLQGLMNASQTKEDFFVNAWQTNNLLIETLGENVISFGSEYGFVCSQLVMSQLRNIPDHYMKVLLQEKYGLSPQDFQKESSYPFFVSSQNLLTKLQQEHIKLLTQSVSSNGVVYLADTYEKAIYPRYHYPPVHVEQVSSKEVDPVIFGNLDKVKESESWIWPDSFDRQGDRQDFVVIAHTLEKRSSI